MACYLVNRPPSTAIDLKTSIEVWSSAPANYSNLRIFWCLAYAHIDDGKLEQRALKCIFLGYATGVKGYRFWCVELKSPKFIINRDFEFNESSMLHLKKEIVDTETNHDASKQVEFESEPPK